MGCAVSGQWVTAVADGFIVRATDGAVMQDLDGDGYEQTGWDVLYMHVFTRDRVQPGSYVYAGDRLGHPSCEGGIANAAHLHIARKYSGEWIPADASLPFVLGGWTSSGTGVEYDGRLRREARPWRLRKVRRRSIRYALKAPVIDQSDPCGIHPDQYNFRWSRSETIRSLVFVLSVLAMPAPVPNLWGTYRTPTPFFPVRRIRPCRVSRRQRRPPSRRS
jgi:hypothetical protein